jgi:signal peptidase I
LRAVVELTVSLVVLVVLFRTFLVAGYMIETGSMAPCLVGFHWQATCPSCRFSFAIEGSRAATKAVCPNCGKSGISVADLPRNDGDHLLVHRSAYALRDLRRWEVVVFRNPNRPTQAFVKRMIALPGEAVEILDGDVFINGKIQPKPYATQRGMRIPVYDHDYRPDDDDPDWQPRWTPEASNAGWQSDGGAFRFSPRRASPRDKQPEPLAWVEYRHWIRRGGVHKTSVPMPHWPAAVPEPVLGPLSFDAAAGELVCRGALSRERRDELLGPLGDPALREALERLYEMSHIAPITDTYGYNRGPVGGGDEVVRDLMIELRLVVNDAAGLFALEMSDGTETLQCLFDFEQRSVRLLDTRTGKAVRTAELPSSLVRGSAIVEMSLLDRQALVAVDGALAFEPWSYPAGVDPGSTPMRPVRFGARGARLDVDRLKLFRDVHYTLGDGWRYTGRVTSLRSNEYFVLGDNSPLSRDSRSWSDDTRLEADMFLGKPLVVHLPSRRSRFRVGSWQTEIRIPELSRIRYIH